ncbi:hypothetical protein CDAR_198661 [Caerostris darwini]|uniref:Uncharacterized protein n=1 Tax=Caerostris darwini TaxID=1538125 RepID=A0AAV4W4N5_9ARAC|nr:hypothetical protein CDAR_198661 [Caerostris darwini]
MVANNITKFNGSGNGNIIDHSVDCALLLYFMLHLIPISSTPPRSLYHVALTMLTIAFIQMGSLLSQFFCHSLHNQFFAIVFISSGVLMLQWHELLLDKVRSRQPSISKIHLISLVKFHQHGA